MSMSSVAVRRGTNIVLVLTLVWTGIWVGACSKKEEKKADEQTGPAAPSAEENTMGDSDTGKAMGLQTVHFGYDSYVLNKEAKTTLAANVGVLKDKASLKIQVEGHCDQRGGIQYNIALGEKRANATRKYMIDKGVAGDRITVISYGKERPVDAGATDEAYAKNRRANFVITSK